LGLQTYFRTTTNPPMEGLVLEHEGQFWKVRADGFHPPCRFQVGKAAAQPPIFLAPKKG